MIVPSEYINEQILEILYVFFTPLNSLSYFLSLCLIALSSLADYLVQSFSSLIDSLAIHILPFIS